jgi:pantetheine-phosphate adenylyltransferase
MNRPTANRPRSETPDDGGEWRRPTASTVTSSDRCDSLPANTNPKPLYREVSMPTHMMVALGGTFDPVHDGHRSLFEHAFSVGSVTVGLTSDELAPKTRNEDRYVRSFADRKADLETELAHFAEAEGREYEIRELEEPTGIATEPQFDVLVVSPETETGGRRINEIRREMGHDPLDIQVVDHVYAEDGEIISSTRIVKGEIDEHGNLTPDRDGRSQHETGA